LELDRFAVSAKHKRSRVPDAAQRLISAFTRVFDTLWAVHRRAQTQNRENNPMQSRLGPGSQHSCGLRPGHEKKNGPSSRPQPNLILPRSDPNTRIRSRSEPKAPEHALDDSSRSAS
jgi:hypothetical protein